MAIRNDGGRIVADDQPLLDLSQTWRSLFTAILLTIVAAITLGLSLGFQADRWRPLYAR